MITIQIGNTDNALTQQEWSLFCSQLRVMCANVGQIHFAGGSNPDSPYQNYCVCVDVTESELENFKTKISDLRLRFRQDSIAFTKGFTQFL